MFVIFCVESYDDDYNDDFVQETPQKKSNAAPMKSKTNNSSAAVSLPSPLPSRPRAPSPDIDDDYGDEEFQQPKATQKSKDYDEGKTMMKKCVQEINQYTRSLLIFSFSALIDICPF